MSIFVHMGIVDHDDDIVGHCRMQNIGKLYLKFTLVSFDILWTFTNTTPYRLFCGCGVNGYYYL